MIAIVGMALIQAYEVAKAEQDYVQSLSPEHQTLYWTNKAKQAEIDRQERAVRALEELAAQGRYPVSSGSVLSLALGMALGSAS